ncbi:RNA polymerase sigma factor [Neorhodopirellula pilleata]|nr:sigma-70 family RNA polymerase sigma factor [Neorhodopirellula pilleata]
MNNQVMPPPIAPPPTRRSAAGIVKNWDRLTDADLLDAWCRDRNRDAFNELVRRYRGMVLSLCQRTCRNSADAEDAFQTTWVCLATSAHQIRRPDRLAGWLHRVATRASRMTYPRHDTEMNPGVEPIDPGETAWESLTRRHEARVLDEELAQLPSRYQSAVVLHIMQGESYEAIAARLETTTGAIRGCVQRGKRILAARLRHRGVVPVLAFAAAMASSASDAEAADLWERFHIDAEPDGIDWSTAEPAVRDPNSGSPIDFSSLLSSGNMTMRLTPLGWASLTAFVAAAVMISMIPVSGQEQRPAVQVQMASSPNEGTPNAPPVQLVPKKNSRMSTQDKDEPVPDRFATGVARRVAEQLDQNDDLTLDAKLDGLAAQLESQWGIPVLVDPDAFEMAELEPSSTMVTFDGRDQPIRTMLRRILKPLRLTTRIEDEGLVITPDFTELTRDGIATDRWVSVSQELVQQFETALNQSLSLDFIDAPLEEVVEMISAEIEVPIMIDKPALENFGLTADVPIDFVSNQLPARSVLKQIFQDLDLAYSYQNGMIVIGTDESVQSRLLSRIYFLEGTGLPRGDYEEALSLIQTSIQPNVWEALGGPGSIAPIGDGRSGRPSILVTSTISVHDEIALLLEALRKSHVGPDPIVTREELERKQVEAAANMGGGGFGVGGGFF